MSRHRDNAYARYELVSEDGATYGSNPDDYFWLADDEVFSESALIRLDHAYVTTTGRIVVAPRLIKFEPRLSDLRRLQRARASLRQAQQSATPIPDDASSVYTEEEV